MTWAAGSGRHGSFLLPASRRSRARARPEAACRLSWPRWVSAAARCCRWTTTPCCVASSRLSSSHPALPPTRSAVLSLDDDILLPCADVEAGFARWRAAPHQLVGWYPRLLLRAGGAGAGQGRGPPTYQFEPAVFEQVRCGGAGVWPACVCCLAARLLHPYCAPSHAQPSNPALPCHHVSPTAGRVQRHPGGRRLHGRRHPVPRLLCRGGRARARPGGRGAGGAWVLEGGCWRVGASREGCVQVERTAAGKRLSRRQPLPR